MSGTSWISDKLGLELLGSLIVKWDVNECEGLTYIDHRGGPGGPFTTGHFRLKNGLTVHENLSR